MCRRCSTDKGHDVKYITHDAQRGIVVVETIHGTYKVLRNDEVFVTQQHDCGTCSFALCKGGENHETSGFAATY